MEIPNVRGDVPTRLQRLNAHIFVLHDGIRSREGFKAYYLDLEKSYGHTEAYSQMIELAHLVDPDDEPAEPGVSNPAVHCFVTGAAYGLDIAADVLGEVDTDQALCRVTEELRRSFDLQQDASGSSERPEDERDAIIERASLGYYYAGAYHQFIDQAKQTIAPKEKYEDFVILGFGYVMFVVMAALYRQDQPGVREFAVEVEGTDRDWDDISRNMTRDYYRGEAEAHLALMDELTQDFTDTRPIPRQ